MAAAAPSGFGTLDVGVADVAAAADELRATRQADVEKPPGLPPVRWSGAEALVSPRGARPAYSARLCMAKN
jgi:hypothetical protein